MEEKKNKLDEVKDRNERSSLQYRVQALEGLIDSANSMLGTLTHLDWRRSWYKARLDEYELEYVEITGRRYESKQ